MKNILINLIFVSTAFAFGQNLQKEKVYILFENSSTEKCFEEDGSGNTNYVNKFRKELLEDHVYFRICNELFSSKKVYISKNVYSKIEVDSLNLVNINYLKSKSKGVKDFNHQIFNNIFLIEEISKDKFYIHEVSWIDDILIMEN